MRSNTWAEQVYEEFKIYFPEIERNVVGYIFREELDELVLDMKDGSRCVYDELNTSLGTISHEIDRKWMTEADWYEEFRHILKRRMRVKGISQQKLSVMTNLSQSMINQYTTGRSLPSVYALELIESALDCDLRGLMLCDLPRE